MSVRLFVMSVMVLNLSSCAAEPPGKTCISGSSAPCACPDGNPGAQLCEQGVFAACQCDPPDDPSDAALVVSDAAPRDAAPRDAASRDATAGPADAAPGPADASTPDASPRDAAPSGVKRVFVTALTLTGDAVGGLAGADAKCQSIADTTTAAGLADLGGSHWKAWLSDSSTDAIDRIADVGPWYLVDRTTRVFRNKAHLALMPAVLDNPIRLTERGTDATQASYWTGSLAGGRRSTSHCSNWTSYSTSGLTGRASATDDTWTLWQYLYCANPRSLVCFEQ